jgi:hypothetical protein
VPQPATPLRFRFAPGNAVLFTGADGIQWTKDLIKSEGRRVGLGLSAQDSARQGLANEVLIGRVNRELSGTGAHRYFAQAPSVLTTPQWQALRLMPTGKPSSPVRLRDGLTIDQAAQVARRSLTRLLLDPDG